MIGVVVIRGIQILQTGTQTGKKHKIIWISQNQCQEQGMKNFALGFFVVIKNIPIIPIDIVGIR